MTDDALIRVLIHPGDAPAVPSGLVARGATGSQQDANIAKAAQKAVGKVIEVSAGQIADGVLGIAQNIGPAVRAKLQALQGVSVHEVSVGCSIGVDGTVLVAGVSAEATLTVTFKIA